MKKLSLPIIFVILTIILIGTVIILNRINEPANTQSIAQQATDPTLTELARDLEVPWAMTFLPDGTMLFTERGGKIKKLQNGQVSEVLKIDEVRQVAEGGLLGIAAHPNFSQNGYVYVHYTFGGAGGTLLNKVVRYTYLNNQMGDPTIVLNNIPGATTHDGGRIKFGPDGYLYITTGDADNTSNAQNTNSLAGKILRITDTGAPAPGNPFNNEVWSYGHRHPQGITWDGSTMYSIEHGQSFPSCCDEINRIEPGKNYGWPDSMGDDANDGTVKNIMHSGYDENTSWAPSGMAYYNGSIFFAGLRGAALYEAKITGDSGTVVAEHFKNQIGRVRDVIVGPDNLLYISVTNKDGRGEPKDGDDKIFKVEFPGMATTPVPPEGITPTLYCLGGVPCDEPQPTAGGQPTPGTGVTVGPDDGSDPVPTGGTPGTPGTDPCIVSSNSLDASSLHYKHHSGGGFFQRMFEFFMRILELLLRLIFGGGLPIDPNNPVPNQPDNPNQPAPTQGVPCPTPTDNAAPTEPVEVPTQNPGEPTSGATIAPTTTEPNPNPNPGDGDPTADTCNGSAQNPVSPVTGYSLSKCEDFNSGLGAFNAYNGGGGSTVVGRGRVADKCTNEGGMLVLTQDADGATCGGSMDFAQKYGYWEVKMRTYSTGSGGSAPHPVLILWPDTDVWNDGELDYFETDLGDGGMGVFLHCVGNASSNCYHTTHDMDISTWHVYGFEWTASGFKGFVDGELIYETDGNGSNPSVSMHQTIQLDNLSGKTPVSPGKMEVDWVHMYSK